jgi:hypothetical protein
MAYVDSAARISATERAGMADMVTVVIADSLKLATMKINGRNMRSQHTETRQESTGGNCQALPEECSETEY